MKCIEILEKHKVSVTKLAEKLRISRQHLYRLLYEFDKGNLASRNATIDWGLEYLFSEKLDTFEFINRMAEVEYRINNTDKLGKQVSKEAFNVGKNRYITKNYVRTFEYNKIKDDMYELRINDMDIYQITKEQLMTFLYMYDL